MVCKCKPVSPVRGLSPLRGDLPQQRSLDGRSKGGEIYVGITTLSLTQLRQTQAPPQPIVPFFKFQYHSLLLKQLSPPLSGGTNPVFSGNLKWELPYSWTKFDLHSDCYWNEWYQMCRCKISWVAGRPMILFASILVGGEQGWHCLLGKRDMADGKRVIEVLSDICLPNLLVCLLNMFLWEESNH